MAVTYGAVTATTTAAMLQSGQHVLTIQNRGPASIFVASDSSVAASTGLELLPGGSREVFGVVAYVITAAGTADVRWSID